MSQNLSNISTLYSIGHGQKSIEEFIAELRSFDIHYLVDVRTSPFSKWAPQFNHGVIENSLAQSNIRYIYWGDSIGGRPDNDSCYDDDGFYDYQRMAQEPKFQAGLVRLVNANSKNCRVAVMCSESDPSECHRSKLIGRELYFSHGIKMNHIIGINKIVSQEDIMIKLTKNRWVPEGNLFGDNTPPYFKSRKSYKTTSSAENEFQYNYND